MVAFELCSAVVLFPGVESQQNNFSTQGWFIGTLCAVTVLTLVVLIACLVRRNKGGKYAGTPSPPQLQDKFAMEKGQSMFDQGWVVLPRHFRMSIKILLKILITHIEDPGPLENQQLRLLCFDFC